MPLPIAAIALAIAQVAAPALVPQLVRAVGGDQAAGDVARQVVDAAMKATGADTPEKAAELVAGDPTATLLARGDLLELERVALERERVANEDRADARAREATLRDNTPRWLAFATVAGFMCYCFTLLIAALLGLQGIKDPLVAGLLGTGFGALGGEAARVGNYFFGSSAGSAAKQATLDKLTAGR
jgi:hypothetical protein